MMHDMILKKYKYRIREYVSFCMDDRQNSTGDAEQERNKADHICNKKNKNCSVVNIFKAYSLHKLPLQQGSTEMP
jgi:hypothetical protein